MDFWVNVCFLGKIHGVGGDGSRGSLSVVRNYFGILLLINTIHEDLDGGITIHTESLSELLVLCSIDFSKLDCSFSIGGSLFPFWLKSLAMSTPRSIKLYHPNIFRLHNKGVEVRHVQDNNLVSIAFLFSTSAALLL